MNLQTSFTTFCSRGTHYIGGGAIFLVGGRGGGSSGETKIAEGIRDAKNHRSVLYIAFAGKSGGLQPPQPPACRPFTKVPPQLQPYWLKI